VDFRTPEQLVAYLRDEASRRGAHNRASAVDSGQRGLIVARLDLAFGGDTGRLAFLKEVFGLVSSHDMTRAQYYALRDWLVPPQDPGVLIPKRAGPEHLLTPQGYAEAQSWLTAWHLKHGQRTLLDVTPDDF
jgi:hypothetical protein